MLGDTWEWDGENWTQVADIGPSQRFFHGMAYDIVRQTLILFGGQDSGGAQNDTWEWDGEFWTQLDDSGPPPRSQFGMAGDSRRQRIVIFGGEGRSGQLADTWEWDGNEWTQQEDQGPRARSGQAMAFDIQNGNTVLHGGVETINLHVGDGNDTWVWNGTVWTQVSDMGPALNNHAMASSGKGVLLCGGDIAGTWTWDGKHWTQRQDIGPRSRHMIGLAGDFDRGRVVLFGGEKTADAIGYNVLGDTWEAFEAAPVG
jgi:hypothetical protein